MLKMKKMIVVVMMILTICLLATMNLEVKATGADNPIDISQDLDITIGGDDTNATDANAIAANEMVANQIAANSQVIQPETNTDSNSAGNTLPQTGVTEDITVMFFIIVCAISAIYAYKKIRDYNA